MMRKTLLIVLFALIVIYPLSAYAQSENSASTSGESQQEKQAGQIKNQQQETPTAGVQQKEERKSVQATPVAQGNQPEKQAAQVKDQQQETPTVGEQHREEKKSVQATPVEQGGALLPYGRFVVEPFFEYDHISSQNVSLSGYTIFEAILIGQVTVEKIRRDLYIPGATFRFGLKDFEINAKIPYYFRNDSLIFPQSGSGTSQLDEKNLSDNDLGDIESYIYYYLIKEGPIAPDTIIRAGVSFPTGKDPYHCKRQYIPELGAVVPVEFPTGTGHWGSSVGVTLAKSADPAVVFMNLAYYYNFSRNVGIVNGIDYGDIKLGNSFEFNLGLVFAIQERLSISFAYDDRITQHSYQNNNMLADTALNAIAFDIGATYVLSPRLTLDFVVALGMSQDAPDVSALVRVPITFQF